MQNNTNVPDHTPKETATRLRELAANTASLVTEVEVARKERDAYFESFTQKIDGEIAALQDSQAALEEAQISYMLKQETEAMKLVGELTDDGHNAEEIEAALIHDHDGDQKID